MSHTPNRPCFYYRGDCFPPLRHGTFRGFPNPFLEQMALLSPSQSCILPRTLCTCLCWGFNPRFKVWSSEVNNICQHALISSFPLSVVVTKRRQILTVRPRILVPPVVAASSPRLPLDRRPMHPGDAPAMVATALTFVRVVLWSVGVEEPGCPTTGGGQLGGLRIVLGVGTVSIGSP